MHRDFSEMLSALSDAGAEFLIVGAHALGAHGHPRATRDLDIWVNATPENARRVWRARADYGAPLHDLTEQELATPGIIFQIGVAPFRIDIMTDIAGVAFADAWPDRITVELGGRRVPVIGRAQFIATKRAAGRPRDLADIADLEGR
ncbi:MAG: nucleotidyltransferase [Gemmatimonadota bacterium]